MLFCILRWRRLPRSTAFDVEGKSASSRKVSAFSRFGEKSFLSATPKVLKRRTRRRSRASLESAVSTRQRRSNRRYISSIMNLIARRRGTPRVMRRRIFSSFPERERRTNRCRCSKSSSIFVWRRFFSRAAFRSACEEGRPGFNSGRAFLNSFRICETALRMALLISLSI